ncbi:MAG: hypothetical protein LYZ66_04435 [Nitrososphaerales archaeon]|nr:hypothetical protein [Nitrososphaerales archaeon]
MDPDFLLNLVDAVLIIGVAIPSLYMATRVKQPSLRTLTILLASFLGFHGFYHAFTVFGMLPGLDVLGTAADLFFEPFGYLLLFAFAISFARRTG